VCVSLSVQESYTYLRALDVMSKFCTFKADAMCLLSQVLSTLPLGKEHVSQFAP